MTDPIPPRPPSGKAHKYRYIIFHKPYGVLSSVVDAQGRPTLSAHVPVPGVYAAGRLDQDSEGLMLLTDDGVLAHRLTHPDHKLPKTYVVQVERVPDEAALESLRTGVLVKGEMTEPAEVERLETEPALPPRTVPIRDMPSVPTTWLRVVLSEGRKRQVRHMTAAVGYPTLRLVRLAIGPLTLSGLEPGQWRELAQDEVHALAGALGLPLEREVATPIGTPKQAIKPPARRRTPPRDQRAAGRDTGDRSRARRPLAWRESEDRPARSGGSRPEREPANETEAPSRRPVRPAQRAEPRTPQRAAPRDETPAGPGSDRPARRSLRRPLDQRGAPYRRDVRSPERSERSEPRPPREMREPRAEAPDGMAGDRPRRPERMDDRPARRPSGGASGPSRGPHRSSRPRPAPSDSGRPRAEGQEQDAGRPPQGAGPVGRGRRPPGDTPAPSRKPFAARRGPSGPGGGRPGGKRPPRKGGR